MNGIGTNRPPDPLRPRPLMPDGALPEQPQDTKRPAVASGALWKNRMSASAPQISATGRFITSSRTFSASAVER